VLKTLQEGVPAFTVAQPPEAMKVLEDRFKELKVRTPSFILSLSPHFLLIQASELSVTPGILDNHVELGNLTHAVL